MQDGAEPRPGLQNLGRARSGWETLPDMPSAMNTARSVPENEQAGRAQDGGVTDERRTPQAVEHALLVDLDQFRHGHAQVLEGIVHITARFETGLKACPGRLQRVQHPGLTRLRDIRSRLAQRRLELPAPLLRPLLGYCCGKRRAFMAVSISLPQAMES
jgi:hypothetical protein